MKENKTCKFSRKSSFSSYVQQKTEKQTIQLTLCQLDVGGWQKEKGMRLTESVYLFYVAWKRGLPGKFACFALFCLIKKCFLISFVFWINFAEPVSPSVVSSHERMGTLDFPGPVVSVSNQSLAVPGIPSQCSSGTIELYTDATLQGWGGHVDFLSQPVTEHTLRNSFTSTGLN